MCHTRVTQCIHFDCNYQSRTVIKPCRSCSDLFMKIKMCWVARNINEAKLPVALMPKITICNSINNLPVSRLNKIWLSFIQLIKPTIEWGKLSLTVSVDARSCVNVSIWEKRRDKRFNFCLIFCLFTLRDFKTKNVTSCLIKINTQNGF